MQGREMKVNVDVIGEKEVLRALKNLSTEKSRKVKGEVYVTGLDVQRIARERLAGRSGGTKAWKTGNLANSIIVDMVESGKFVEVGPEAPYGPYIEYGTIKMAARPYLFPAWLAVKDLFWKKIKELLAR